MKKIPFWVLAIGVLFAIAPLALSISGYMNPEAGPGVAEGDVPSLAGTYGMFLSRNVATGLIMIAALLWRSPGMLLSAFLMRTFSDMIDILNVYAGGGGFMAAFLVFVALSVPCIIVLARMVQRTSYGSNKVA